MKKTMQRIGMAGLLFAALTLFGGAQTNNPKSTLGSLMVKALESGARIGYRCASMGGTTNDLAYIIKAMRDDRPDLVEGWFAGRR